MGELQMEYALSSTGQLMHSTLASRKERHRCLECGSAVVLRKPAGQPAVFLHVGPVDCNGAQVPLQAARHRLKSFLEGRKDQTSRVHWIRKCPGLDPSRGCRRHGLGVRSTRLPAFDHIELGFPLEDHLQLDVALLLEGELVFGLFFLPPVKTPVDLHWVQVSPEQVLRDPGNLQLLDLSGGAPLCEGCQQEAGMFRQNPPEKPVLQDPEARHLQEMQQRQVRAMVVNRQQRENLELRYGKLFPFVRRYFAEHGIQPQHQVESNFTATRCVQCKKPVVFFDTSRFIPEAAKFPRLLRKDPQVEARGARRHLYINVCPHCGRWHRHRVIEAIHEKNRNTEEQVCIIFSGEQYLRWLEGQQQVQVDAAVDLSEG